MKKSTSATSIVESLIVMLIIVTGITWMYNIFSQSQKLSDTTGNRIEAIQIAREWIEAMTNVRNTNWVLFAADYKNCWNTFDYDNRCIWDTANTDIVDGNSYKIYQDSSTDRWILENETSWVYSDSWYRNRFQVFKDTNGFYSQSSWTPFSPIFTREIIIEYLDSDWWWAPNSDDEKMRVTSRVQWQDSSRSTPYNLELETILTNWKNKN